MRPNFNVTFGNSTTIDLFLLDKESIKKGLNHKNGCRLYVASLTLLEEKEIRRISLLKLYI